MKVDVTDDQLSKQKYSTPKHLLRISQSYNYTIGCMEMSVVVSICLCMNHCTKLSL